MTTCFDERRAGRAEAVDRVDWAAGWQLGLAWPEFKPVEPAQLGQAKPKTIRQLAQFELEMCQNQKPKGVPFGL